MNIVEEQEAIVLSCSKDKKELAALLGLLNGVTEVHKGHKSLVVITEEGSKDSFMNVLSRIKGVSNIEYTNVKFSSIRIWSIEGGKGGWYFEGIKLPDSIDAHLTYPVCHTCSLTPMEENLNEQLLQVDIGQCELSY